MINIKYALVTKTVTQRMHEDISKADILSKVCFCGDSGVPVESRIFLSVESEEYTYFYCCNNNAYKYLTSALVFESHYVYS